MSEDQGGRNRRITMVLVLLGVTIATFGAYFFVRWMMGR